MEDSSLKKGGFLNKIEKIGNALPNITMLFIYAIIICWLLSFLLSFVNFHFLDPTVNDGVTTIKIVNMLSYKELVTFLTKIVSNFLNYPPLGMVIVATLGIGIAEGSGFIKVALRSMLAYIPKAFLTPYIAFIAVLAHLASDSVYVILLPAAAAIFYASGRHPLAGISTAFGALAGGFSASFTPVMIDPIMQRLTQDAAQIIDKSYEVNVLCNYFYSAFAAIVVILACWFVTDKIVEPWLKRNLPFEANQDDDFKELSFEEKKAFKSAGRLFLFLLALLVILALPTSSPFRASDGSLTSANSAIMQAIVPFLFIFFALPGILYGYKTQVFKSSKDVIKTMEDTLKTLVPFMVFCFFAGQFIYAFNVSNLGKLISASGAEFLQFLHMPAFGTILGIILLTACVNMLITSATSKWTVMAPIFVPMLMSVGLSPELTQAAFRLSAAMNVSTPMFPFYPLIIGYCLKYSKKTGVGTLASMMLPYTLVLMLVLTLTLMAFWFFNIPLGFDSSYIYPKA